MMRRMTAGDALHLYNEVPTQHLHTLKIAIIDPSDDPDGYSFEREKQKLAARLDRVPPFRWLAVPTPFALHHPLWVEAPIDIEHHVRRAAVPAPGGREELGELIAEIASRPLDRKRPLWEQWMIEGIGDGCICAVTKLHHSLADGVASSVLLTHYLTPDPDADVVEEKPWSPDPIPERGELLRLALRDLAHFLPAAVSKLVKAARIARERVAARGADTAHQPPAAFSAPETSFNGLLTAQRRFAFLSLPLAEIRAVREASGTTVNDVVLATVAGALRRYLMQRDELPDRALVASVPVSTRPSEEAESYGNFVSVMYMDLHTEIEDPVARLAASREAALTAKQDFDDTVGARLPDWLEIFPPFLIQFLFSRSTTIMKRMHRPSQANVIVSNVRGPSEPLFYGHSRMKAFYSVGPVLEGVGLNVTAWSYVDDLNVGLIACRDAVPQLWELADGLRDSLAELRRAVEARAAAS